MARIVRFVAIVPCLLIAGVGCEDTAHPSIHAGNVDAVAVAATEAATDAYFASLAALLIGRDVGPNAPSALRFNFTELIFDPPLQTGPAFGDLECLGLGNPGDDDWYIDMDACGFATCEIDGLAWNGPGNRVWSGQWSFEFDEVAIECGAPERALDLHGHTVTCTGHRQLDWRCEVRPGGDQALTTEVSSSAAIREYWDPSLEERPVHRARFDLNGVVAAGSRRIAFETDGYPLSFEKCPWMVPGSGELHLAGSDGARATVSYRGCERYEVCLEGLEAGDDPSEECETFDWLPLTTP